MKFIFFTLCLFLFPFVVQAGEQTPDPCQTLTAYKAGVDVRGKAVASADLNAATSADIVPDVMKVPLSVDFAQRMQVLQGKGVQLDAPLGMLEIHSDGSVRYNDADWTTPVTTLCAQSRRSVVNRTKILNRSKIINRGALPSEKPVASKQDGKSLKVKTSKVKVIEVRPSVAIPPQDVLQKEKPLVIKEVKKQAETIEGGDYREIFYNE